jgi:predicted nucleic acid-binding protein
VLFDTDVLLDLLLDRRPHAQPAARLLSRIERGDITGFLCSNAVTTIHYVARKDVGSRQARNLVLAVLSLLEVAPVNRAILQSALSLPFEDYEDAVTHESARQVNANSIVTRNIPDFRRSDIPVFTPTGLLALLAASEQQGN